MVGQLTSLCLFSFTLHCTRLSELILPWQDIKQFQWHKVNVVCKVEDNQREENQMQDGRISFPRVEERRVRTAEKAAHWGGVRCAVVSTTWRDPNRVCIFKTARMVFRVHAAPQDACENSRVLANCWPMFKLVETTWWIRSSRARAQQVENHG